MKTQTTQLNVGSLYSAMAPSSEFMMVNTEAQLESVRKKRQIDVLPILYNTDPGHSYH